MKTLRQFFAWLTLCLLTSTSFAHKASDAWLSLLPDGSWQYSLAVRDFDSALETLDANADRQLTWGELQAGQSAITELVSQGISLRCNNTVLPLRWTYQALEQRSDGVFVRLVAPSVASACASDALELRYAMLMSIDADHRAILAVTSTANVAAASQAVSSRVLQPSEAWHPAVPDHSPLGSLLSFIRLGIEHIGSGADHIAFVVCLVLGIALFRQWRDLLLTITAFTLGHSITLISATLGWVGSPAWVEPVIAGSIGIAAAMNLLPQHLRWLQLIWPKIAIAALFGLVHGLGFSGAMTEAQVPEGSLLWALAGFNIGVEIGQLLIIAAWSIIYFALHRWAGYKKYFVPTACWVLIALSLYWLIERLQ